MTDMTERAWGNYTAMLGFLTQGGFESAQGVIQPFNFASLYSYNTSAPNYSMYLLMNAINVVTSGTPVDENGEHTDPATNLSRASKLTDAYEYFLDQLDVILAKAVKPEELPEYKALQQAVNDRRKEVEDYEGIVSDNWARFRARNPDIPVAQLSARRIMWEAENGYSYERERRQRLIAAANVQLNAWMRTKLPAEFAKIVMARQYFEDPNYKVLLPLASAFDNQNQINLWRPYHFQLPNFDLSEFLKNSTVITNGFSTKEEHYKRIETKWKVKAKARWGFFSSGASAERREMEEVSQKSDFSFKVSFQRFDEVAITRDQWFQETLFDTVGRQLRGFWGPNGSLGRIPVSLLMARGMRIEVSASDEYRRTVEKFFSGGGGASFGPFFSGGGGYSKDERYMDYKSEGEGFSLTDSDSTIRLLGTRVRLRNWDEKDVRSYRAGISESEAKAADTALSAALTSARR